MASAKVMTASAQGGALSIRLDPLPTKSDGRGTFSNSMSEDERGVKNCLALILGFWESLSIL
ncbi:hypothetical protein PVK06_026224 [Gossypium arboreum]|uniref:Uncharacterized protein n=1 Tax=Gossypium arboreum TaxID=29729 RepID=A0ABR0NXM1_GOSAR|nr:hypothetical protein PVK06_026224 [Gossypium arboreum]